MLHIVAKYTEIKREQAKREKEAEMLDSESICKYVHALIQIIYSHAQCAMCNMLERWWLSNDDSLFQTVYSAFSVIYCQYERLIRG